MDEEEDFGVPKTKNEVLLNELPEETVIIRFNIAFFHFALQSDS
jgi:hypothetical protein